MRYKKFKNADCSVSSLAVGTWSIGESRYGKLKTADSIEGIQAMIEAGANLIDTAPVYGNGTSEKIVGAAIQGFKRQDLLLSSKFGLVTDIYSKEAQRDASYKNIMREVESSLENLRTDYMDFYYVHWPDEHTPIAETMSALNYLKHEGIIKYIGVSNFSKEQILAAEKYGQIDVQQIPYSMVNVTDHDLIDWGFKKGIDAMTYGSLGAGILSGAIRELPHFAEDDIRSTFYDYYREPKFSKIMSLLDVLDEISEKYKKPIPQIVINWSTQQEIVGTALVGINNREQAMENCQAFDWELAKEDIEKIDHKIQGIQLDK